MTKMFRSMNKMIIYLETKSFLNLLYPLDP